MDRTQPSLALSAADALIEVSTLSSFPVWLIDALTHTYRDHAHMYRTLGEPTHAFTLRKPRRRFFLCNEEAGVTVNFEKNKEDTFVREFSGKYTMNNCESHSVLLY